MTAPSNTNQADAAVYGAGKTTPAAPRKPVSLPRLADMRARNEKITMLTAYDATFAAVADAAGVDTILIGDSLGMVCQGLNSTTGVSLDTMAYHVESVSRGLIRSQGTAFLIGDLPYGSYHESREQAMRSAARLMQAGAHMVKLEGGAFMAETTRFLVERGVPVCAHIGLTPQFVNTFGGYRVQGKTDDAAERILADAHALADAGASLVLMECVPAALGKTITQSIAVPTIGIGAGVHTSGQVLVLYDVLGVYPGKKARFVKNFMTEAGSIHGAIKAYLAAVKAGTFPAEEHSF